MNAILSGWTGCRRWSRARRPASAPRSPSRWPRPAPTSRATATPTRPPTTAARGARRRAGARSSCAADCRAARRAPSATGRRHASRASGGIDILVNNAGTIRRAPAVEVADDDWDAVLEREPDQRVPPVPARGTRHARPRVAARSSTSPRCCRSRAASTCRPTRPRRAAWRSSPRRWPTSGPARASTSTPSRPATSAPTTPRALQQDPARNRQILERIPAGRWGEPRRSGRRRRVLVLVGGE